MTTDAFTEAEKAQAIETLGEWFRLDTWTVREGLLLLVGIDPLRSGDLNFTPKGVTTGPNPAWARITKKPGVLVGEDNVPRPDGLIMEPMAMYRLWELMRFWRATSGHSDDWDSRAKPSYFVSWAQSKGFGPFWADWMRPAPATVGACASGPAPVDESNWKMRVQEEATTRCRDHRKRGRSPTKASLSEELVTWCRNNEVKTSIGVYPTASYIRTHVLGKGWSMPP